MEPADHQVAVDRVGERDERHAGVMREERGHRRAGAADAAAGAIGVVDRLEESVVAEQPVGGEPAEILRASSPGSIITASAVAYGATTSSSPRPRFRPSPGTPNALY